MNTKTVAIFGVFDGIHDGHLSLINEARKEGDRLVAIVARDSEVEKIKGKLPRYDEASRIAFLLEIPELDTVYLGDLEQGTYKILNEIKPNVIYLGYDQQALEDSLNKAMKENILPQIEIKHGIAHKPEIFKSSLLNKNNDEQLV